MGKGKVGEAADREADLIISDSTALWSPGISLRPAVCKIKS